MYTEADIAALMAAAKGLSPVVWAATIEAMVGLLWVTGMRIGEIIRLNVADLDRNAMLLTVWLAKFGKSRHVPITTSTLDALDRYRTVVGTSGPAMFIGRDGQRVRYPQFKSAFDRLLKSTGIMTAAGVLPRTHDVRHSFATTTLLELYRSGADVHAMLPRLSTFLGHVEPSSTYWYLTAAPELMACAAERLEQHQAQLVKR